jgi:hypothetical protein
VLLRLILELYGTECTRGDEAQNFFADVVEVSGMFEVFVRWVVEMRNFSAQSVLDPWTLGKKV